MENFNGKYQPPLMILCATMGLAISVSFCFAQGNREGQLVAAPPEIAPQFPCDSLDPKVCFDIYLRRIQRILAPYGREVCFTGKDARTKDGQTFMAATLIEPEGRPKKFRVSVPRSLQPRGPASSSIRSRRSEAPSLAARPIHARRTMKRRPSWSISSRKARCCKSRWAALPL